MGRQADGQVGKQVHVLRHASRREYSTASFCLGGPSGHVDGLDGRMPFRAGRRAMAIAIRCGWDACMPCHASIRRIFIEKNCKMNGGAVLHGWIDDGIEADRGNGLVCPSARRLLTYLPYRPKPKPAESWWSAPGTSEPGKRTIWGDFSNQSIKSINRSINPNPSIPPCRPRVEGLLSSACLPACLPACSATPFAWVRRG